MERFHRRWVGYFQFQPVFAALCGYGAANPETENEKENLNDPARRAVAHGEKGGKSCLININIIFVLIEVP